MNTLVQVLTILAALLGGLCVARQGIVNASTNATCGTFNTRILNRFVIADFVKIRDGKYFYRLAIAPAP